MWRKWVVIIGMLLCLLVYTITQSTYTTAIKKEEYIQQLLDKELYYDAFLAYEQLYKETKNSQYLYEQAIMALRLQNKTQAIQLFEQVRQVQPYNKQAYNQLLALYDNKDSDDYIQLLYDMAFYFKDDRLLQPIENTVEPFYFKNMTWVSKHNDNVVVALNNKYGIVSLDGTILVDTTFEWIGAYDEQIGFYPARINGKVHYIDEMGYKRIHIQNDVQEIGLTSQNKRWVKMDNKVVYVDNQFNVVLDQNFEEGSSFYNGIAAVKKDGKWGVVNEQGTVILPFDYDDILRDELNYINKHHVIWVKKHNLWQLVTENGQVLSKQNIYQVTPFKSDEPSGVRIDDGWNFMTKTGEVLSSRRYLETTAFHFGHAFVKLEDKQWYIVNQHEETGSSVVADTLQSFNDDKVAMYTLDNDIGYVKLFDGGKYNDIHR